MNPIGATFAGLQLTGSSTFTMTQGTSPSTGTITIPGFVRVPSSGYLVMWDGIRRIQIGPLYPQNPVFVDGPRGRFTQATVADRRVYWKWGCLNGIYNQPYQGQATKEKTLDQLFDLIFTKYGISGWYNYTIPKENYPAVTWENANPAAAAQELCDRYGLSISLLKSGKYWIDTTNAWRSWPAGYVMDREKAYSTAVKPGEIRVVGNRIIDEKVFTNLAPVGLDSDGSIRPIDELSYMPAGIDWGTCALHFWKEVVDATDRELAEKSVFKWYRWNPPSDTDRKKYLPWLDKLSYYGLVDGEPKQIEPYVLMEGSRFDGTTWLHYDKMKVSDGFQIDGEQGIIKFTKMQCKVQTTGAAATKILPAVIDLRAAFAIHTNADNDFYYRSRSMGGDGPVMVHQVGGLQLYRIDGTDKNKTDVDSYADSVLDQLAKQFDVDAPGEHEFAGLLDEEVHGWFKSITWSVSEQGATTKISGGYEEVKPLIPTYEERQQTKKIREALKWQAGDVAPPAPAKGHK